MATTVSTSTTPKMKPPPPPSIQTSNSALPSSSSPSMSSKRPPSLPRQLPSAGGSTATVNSVQSRSQTRQRKESQKAAQSRSGNKVITDGADGLLIPLENMQKQPYVRTSEHVLRKFNGLPPSLVLHLHPTYFRFDQQDGSFGYNSPMKVILEHIKAQTIPHDMLEELEQAGVPFYDGCLIVEVHSHKTTPSASGSQANDNCANSTYKESSIHNYNEHVTPSPYVPYPSPPSENDRNHSASNGEPKVNGQFKSKEDSMGAPPKPVKPDVQGQVPTFTTVLHPTSLSRYRDLCIEATTPMPEVRGLNKRQQAKDSATPMSAYPPTPLSSVPPTPAGAKGGPPAKRQRMRLDESNVHNFEAEVLRNIEQSLFLEPAESFADAQAILHSLTHPLHNQEPPMQKGRKRTVAELAADEAQAAEEERIALVFDERLKPSLNAASSGAGPSAESHGTSKDFEPNFSRFKTLEDIKRRLAEENARKRDEEARRKIAEKEQENRERAQQNMERQKRADEEARRQRELLQRQKATQLEVQAAAAAQANAASLMRGGNPMQQQIMQNLLQQQSSQGQQGSPMMRSHTPSHSSPLNGNVMNGQNTQSIPMGSNLSSQGQGSPPRPGSAMQIGGMAQPMVSQHSQQHSQASQSHHGTPQMPNMTPHMSNGAPAPHMTPQPRIQQGSPSMGPLQGNPMIGMIGGPQINGQNMTQAQQTWMLQQSQQMRQLQQQGNAQMHGPTHPMANPLNPQMLAAMQARQQQQQQQQQGGQQLNNSQPQMSNMPNQNLIAQQKQQEYRRRMAQEAEAKLRPDQQQMRPQSQPQQATTMQPTSSGVVMPANPAISQNMSRNASHQQSFTPQQQQQHLNSTPQMQFQQQNQNGQQSTPQQQQAHSPLNIDAQNIQAQAAQHARAQLAARNSGRMPDRNTFYSMLAQRNGGQVPSNAEAIYRLNFQKTLMQQQQRQQQQQQQMQGQGRLQGRQPQMQQFGFEGALSPNNPAAGNMISGGVSAVGGQNQVLGQGGQQPSGMSPGSGGAGRGMGGGNIDPKLQYLNQLQRQHAIVAQQNNQVMLQQQQQQQQQQQMMAGQGMGMGMQMMHGLGQGGQPGQQGQQQGQGRGGGG